MRTIFAAALVLAFATPALAQSAPVSIPFAPAAGSVWDVTEVRTRTARGEARDETKTSTAHATLTLSGADGDGFDANWVVNRLDAAGLSVTNEPDLFIGLDMPITLDAYGTPASIQDWPGLRRRIFRVMRELTPESERDENWERTVSAVESAFTQWSTGQAAQMLAPALAAMSLCHGTELGVGETVRGTVQLPNALGGPPIDASESLTLDSIDRASGVARLTYVRALDPESAMVAVRESLVNLARQSGQSVEEIERTFAGMTMTHDTRAECVVDLATGMTRSVTHEVVVRMGPAYRADRREISVTAR
jgi:hypothetical protein